MNYDNVHAYPMSDIHLKLILKRLKKNPYQRKQGSVSETHHFVYLFIILNRNLCT